MAEVVKYIRMVSLSGREWCYIAPPRIILFYNILMIMAATILLIAAGIINIYGLRLFPVFSVGLVVAVVLVFRGTAMIGPYKVNSEGKLEFKKSIVRIAYEIILIAVLILLMVALVRFFPE